MKRDTTVTLSLGEDETFEVPHAHYRDVQIIVQIVEWSVGADQVRVTGWSNRTFHGRGKSWCRSPVAVADLPPRISEHLHANP